MPTVIGINQVPPNIPRKTFFDQYGELGGTMSRQVTDALLAALTAGMYQRSSVPTQPTAQNPGSFNFPPGSQSPIEAQQIAQMGGVPTQQGFMSGATQNPGSGVQFIPPTKSVNTQKLINDLKIQQAMDSLNPNSIENLQKKAQTGKILEETKLYQQGVSIDPETGLPVFGGMGGQQGASSNPAFSDSMKKYLAKRALIDGDEEAISLLTEAGEI